MEACTLPLSVKLPEYINKSEFLGCNLNPVVVLQDIRDSLKGTRLGKPQTSPGHDEPEKVEETAISTRGDLRPAGKQSPKKKEVSRVVSPPGANASPKRFKSMKRKRETWDPSVEYEIEEILGYHRDKRNRMLYLVKWKNWSNKHNTFEPIENLTACHYELMRYFEMVEPTRADMLRQSQELGMGLARRAGRRQLMRGARGAQELQEFARECPPALRLMEGGDLDELEAWVAEEYGYILRCLIGMCYHQDPGLVHRGQDYRILLHLIQIRRKQLENNAAFEKQINRLETTKITIENTVDLEEFPSVDYITDLKPGPGVVLSKEPLLGCECPDGCNVRSQCCGRMADSEFAYAPNGRLRTSEKIAIYECNSLCRCPPTCPNRVVQRGREVQLCIFKTKTCGWGVKAEEKIPKGAFVCEYIGEVIPEEEANVRDAKCAVENKSNYLFNLDFFADTSLPMYCIDAAKHGNVARFINHSCNPNLVVYPVWVDGLEPNVHRLAFFAKRHIQKDEEIQFDYKNLGELAADKAEDTTQRNGLRCQCNAAKCRKWVFRYS